MDVSACPLLHHLHVTDVCRVQGWITVRKLLVCVDKCDKVYIMAVCDVGLKKETSVEIVISIQDADKSGITCDMWMLCYCVFWGEYIFQCEVWSWTFVTHCWVLTWERTQVRACDYKSSSCCSVILNLKVETFWLVHNVKGSWDFYVSRLVELIHSDFAIGGDVSPLWSGADVMQWSKSRNLCETTVTHLQTTKDQLYYFNTYLL